MKYYILKHKDGSYFNSEYRTRFRYGVWRDSPRLYKSVRGLRKSFAGISPAFYNVFGKPPTKPSTQNPPWPNTDLEKMKKYWADRSAYWKQVSKLSDDRFFALLAEDGYELIEKEIVP